MLTDTTRSPYAKVHALDGMKVKWTGGLWKERFDTCANSTVPQLKHMFDSKDISHVVENFKICAGDAEGDFDGTVFGDGDFYKWMESAIYTAYQTDNQLLKKEIENYIDPVSYTHLHKIPIHGVMGDSHGSLFGQGCLQPGMIKSTYGTGSSIMMNIGEKPILSTHGVVTSLAWKIGGKVNYVLEGNLNYTCLLYTSRCV